MSFTASCLGALGAVLFSTELIASDVIKAGDPVNQSNAETMAGEPASSANPLVGREVVRTVYPGQPVTQANTRTPFVVRRNQTVTLKYINGSLEITTTGRAMASASAFDTVTVINTQSRQSVTGQVQADGTVLAQ